MGAEELMALYLKQFVMMVLLLICYWRNTLIFWNILLSYSIAFLTVHKQAAMNGTE